MWVLGILTRSSFLCSKHFTAESSSQPIMAEYFHCPIKKSHTYLAVHHTTSLPEPSFRKKQLVLHQVRTRMAFCFIKPQLGPGTSKGRLRSSSAVGGKEPCAVISRTAAVESQNLAGKVPAYLLQSPAPYKLGLVACL